MRDLHRKSPTTSDEEDDAVDEMEEVESEDEVDEEKDDGEDEEEVEEEQEEEVIKQEGSFVADQEIDAENEENESNESDDADDYDGANKENKNSANNNLNGGVKKVPLKYPTTSTPLNAAPSKYNVANSAALTVMQEKMKRKTTEQMVVEALKTLNDRKGTSLVAITKYVISKWPNNSEDRLKANIKRYIKTATEKGTLLQMTGKGASGSFKLSGKQDANAVKKAKETLKKTKAKEKADAKKVATAEKEKAKKMQPKKSATLKVSAEQKAKKKPTQAVKSTNNKTTSKKLGAEHYEDKQADSANSSNNDDEDVFSEDEVNVKKKMPPKKTNKTTKRNNGKRPVEPQAANDDVDIPETKKSKATKSKQSVTIAPMPKGAQPKKQKGNSKTVSSGVAATPPIAEKPIKTVKASKAEMSNDKNAKKKPIKVKQPKKTAA